MTRKTAWDVVVFLKKESRQSAGFSNFCCLPFTVYSYQAVVASEETYKILVHDSQVMIWSPFLTSI